MPKALLISFKSVLFGKVIGAVGFDDNSDRASERERERIRFVKRDLLLITRIVSDSG